MKNLKTRAHTAGRAAAVTFALVVGMTAAAAPAPAQAMRMAGVSCMAGTGGDWSAIGDLWVCKDGDGVVIGSSWKCSD